MLSKEIKETLENAGWSLKEYVYAMDDTAYAEDDIYIRQIPGFHEPIGQENDNPYNLFRIDAHSATLYHNPVPWITYVDKIVYDGTDTDFLEEFRKLANSFNPENLCNSSLVINWTGRTGEDAEKALKDFAKSFLDTSYLLTKPYPFTGIFFQTKGKNGPKDWYYDDIPALMKLVWNRSAASLSSIPGMDDEIVGNKVCYKDYTFDSECTAYFKDVVNTLETLYWDNYNETE